MLFSDVEGSTLLLNRLGPRYVDALDGQRRVQREAWAAHDGTELGTEGDSFFVAFPTAEAAIAAAVQAQRGLEAYPWPAGEHVRVRIGVHTGSPQVHDGRLCRDRRAPCRTDRRIRPRRSGRAVGRHRGPGKGRAFRPVSGCGTSAATG